MTNPLLASNQSDSLMKAFDGPAPAVHERDWLGTRRSHVEEVEIGPDNSVKRGPISTSSPIHSLCPSIWLAGSGRDTMNQDWSPSEGPEAPNQRGWPEGGGLLFSFFCLYFGNQILFFLILMSRFDFLSKNINKEMKR
jgi:hypothetical protein